MLLFAAGGICSLEAFTGGAVVPVYYEAHAAALDDLVQKSAEETLTSHLEKIKTRKFWFRWKEKNMRYRCLMPMNWTEKPLLILLMRRKYENP